MDKINIAVTGYYGTGSSALISLLREFNDSALINFEQENYEHVYFYFKGGLYSLIETIKNCNNSILVDFAINSFLQAMDTLNENDFGWFGSYKKYTNNDFKKIYMDFISSIALESNGRNINHYRATKISFIKLAVQILFKLIYKRPIYAYGRIYRYDNLHTFSIKVNLIQLEEHIKKFNRNYLELYKGSERIKIYDHLLLPQQWRYLNNYFEKDMKLIIVQRDPRDVYILNKFYWSNKLIDGKSFYPVDVEEFICYWKNTFVSSNEISEENILLIHFEDLIYRKSEIVKEISSFLGVSKSSYENEYLYFDENMSIKNTQTFRIKKEWSTEIAKIEDALSDYLYDFPYKIETHFSEMFDNPKFITKNIKI